MLSNYTKYTFESDNEVTYTTEKSYGLQWMSFVLILIYEY